MTWRYLLPNVCHAVSYPWCSRCYFFLVICSETWNSFNPSRGGEGIWANLWKAVRKKENCQRTSSHSLNHTFQHQKELPPSNLSNVNQTLLTFHYTDWLIGILIMAYYNPHMTGLYNPLYTANDQGFGHCQTVPPFSFPSFHLHLHHSWQREAPGHGWTHGLLFVQALINDIRCMYKYMQYRTYMYQIYIYIYIYIIYWNVWKIMFITYNFSIDLALRFPNTSRHR